MITPNDGQDPSAWGEVAVYFNLRTKLWSIRATDGPSKGKVVGYADSVTLVNARFEVNHRMWDRIVNGDGGARGKKRNVVAWVVGKIADAENVVTEPQRVTFKFWDRGDFHIVATGETVTDAPAVIFNENGAWI